MGGSVSCGDSVSVHVGFKSHLVSLGCEESRVKHEQSSCGNTEKNLEEIFVEDIDSSTREEENFNNLIIKELSVSLSETLHIPDPPEPLCVRNSLHQENICNQLEVNFPPFDTDVLEGLSKHATILCSELVQSYLANSDAGGGFSCVTVPNENFSEAENLAFAPQLPTTKLIPALKGSRAQHGIHLNINLSVKWAPEVYDPPVTSSSHTVKGHHRQHHHHHHHRSKAKKDRHNYSHSKGRSSSGSVIERKHSHRRSSGSSLTDPRISRLQALGCNVPLRTSCSQPKMEPLDAAVVKTCEVIRYGSSCYMESFSQLRPVAKAS